MPRIRPSKITGLAAGCLLLIAQTALAQEQFTAQILLPPSEFSQPGALTNAYAMNESGQVFGEAVLYPNDHRPVLWTDGVGAVLPIPAGYYWTDGFDPFGYQFVNNSGLVVSRLRIANGIPNSNWDESRVVVWQNGVPQVLPMPDSCGQSGTGHQFAAPYGLNNLGHILVGTYGDTPCGKLWLWDGSGYQLFFDIANGATFNIGTPARTHLNDADHVAIDRLPGGLSPTCDSNGTITGTMIGTQFTPITGGSALQINNHGQVFLYCTMESQLRLKLWDGADVVDLGFGGFASMNDLGHVVFLAGPGTPPTPKIYKDGVVSDLQLPLFSQTASFVGGSLINSSGQIVVVESLMYGGTNQAVQFTPRTPVITWPKPADITYGTALGPAQLNATANVPGTFVYTPAAGTVLSAAAIQLLSVTFTPSNPLLYDPVTVSNSIGVLSAPLTVKADDTNKVYGAPLPALTASFIGFVNGDGPGSLLGSLALTTGATSSSPTGTYPITASGVSSPNYIISFVPGTLTINPASVTIAMAPFPESFGFLQPFTLFVLMGFPNQDPPVDGSVQFTDGDMVLGTDEVDVPGGVAWLHVNGLAPGVHAITAHYSGSANFLPISSSPVTVTVRPIEASTFTLLIPLTNPQLAGQPAVFAAIVIPFGGGLATGTVEFNDVATRLGTASLTGNVAIFATNRLVEGLHEITAHYVPAGGLAPSNSLFELQTIYTGARPAATATTVAAAGPAPLGSPVALTATVTGGATTGDVYFISNEFVVGHAPILNVGGVLQATVTVSGLPVGANIVSALYVGSPGFASSASILPAVQVVLPPGVGSDSMSAPGAGAQLVRRIRSALNR